MDELTCLEYMLKCAEKDDKDRVTQELLMHASNEFKCMWRLVGKLESVSRVDFSKITRFLETVQEYLKTNEWEGVKPQGLLAEPEYRQMKKYVRVSYLEDYKVSKCVQDWNSTGPREKSLAEAMAQRNSQPATKMQHRRKPSFRNHQINKQESKFEKRVEFHKHLDKDITKNTKRENSDEESKNVKTLKNSNAKRAKPFLEYSAVQEKENAQMSNQKESVTGKENERSFVNAQRRRMNVNRVGIANSRKSFASVTKNFQKDFDKLGGHKCLCRQRASNRNRQIAVDQIEKQTVRKDNVTKEESYNLNKFKPVSRTDGQTKGSYTRTKVTKYVHKGVQVENSNLGIKLSGFKPHKNKQDKETDTYGDEPNVSTSTVGTQSFKADVVGNPSSIDSGHDNGVQHKHTRNKETTTEYGEPSMNINTVETQLLKTDAAENITTVGNEYHNKEYKLEHETDENHLAVVNISNEIENHPNISVTKEVVQANNNSSRGSEPVPNDTNIAAKDRIAVNITLVLNPADSKRQDIVNSSMKEVDMGDEGNISVASTKTLESAESDQSKDDVSSGSKTLLNETTAHRENVLSKDDVASQTKMPVSETVTHTQNDAIDNVVSERRASANEITDKLDSITEETEEIEDTTDNSRVVDVSGAKETETKIANEGQTDVRSSQRIRKEIDVGCVDDLIAEFGKVYDHDWHKAFTALTSCEPSNGLKNSISFLHDILKQSALVVKKMTQNGMTGADSVSAKLHKILPKLKEDFLGTQLRNLCDKFNIVYDNADGESTVNTYASKCVELSCLLASQTPPIDFDFDSRPMLLEELVQIFKPYRRRGKFIQYVVWPALRESHSSVILAKGVADFR